MTARDLTGMTRGARHAVIFLFFLSVALAAASGTFTYEHVARDEHRWCAVLRDPANRQQERDFAFLARQFRCP